MISIREKGFPLSAIWLATQCRSVHAYVKGRIHNDPLPDAPNRVGTVVYRPYVSGTFFDPLTGVTIEGAPCMLFSETGKVYCPKSRPLNAGDP